jgi:acetyl-CoA C-acetyltransferase
LWIKKSFYIIYIESKMIKFTNGRLFSTTRSVVIVGAKRTPVGGFMGALKAIPAPQLGAIAVRGAIEQAGIQPEDVEEGIMGCVLQASLGQAPDR